MRTAEVTATMAGLDGYGFAVIPHPISRLDAAGIAGRAEMIVDRVIERLTVR